VYTSTLRLFFQIVILVSILYFIVLIKYHTCVRVWAPSSTVFSYGEPLPSSTVTYGPSETYQFPLSSFSSLLPPDALIAASSAQQSQPSTALAAPVRPPAARSPVITVPSPLGLPVYSASGFDLLSILSRVATRRHPKINLGPVDFTCSFVVVDVRRFDSPIVYCSPSFSKLTGYEEKEILGRNCRFLQSPDGSVQAGEHRQHTAPEAVMHLRRCLVADKECQTSLINYRKGGQPFVNLVTVIPIFGGVTGSEEENDQVVYHVGFQVDLTQQPNIILEKLREGSYTVNYRSHSETGGPSPYLIGGPNKDRRDRSRRLPGAMSQELRAALADTTFLHSIPISGATTVIPPPGDKDGSDGNHPLNLILLEASPDFIHVLSLKGNFLYVAPSIRRVLGYEPDELVGKTIADFCHPADVVPLMRELKESSTIPTAGPEATTLVHAPKRVDLLYRARNRAGEFVWAEARGRLFVEPGKGRKAIILSGRVRSMQSLEWRTVGKGGGLESGEFGGSVCAAGTFLVVSSSVRDVLGWSVTEVMGRTIATFLVPDEARVMEDEVARMAHDGSIPEPKKIWVNMLRKDGSHASVVVVLYRPLDRGLEPAPLICQVKLSHAASAYENSRLGRLAHPPSSDVFEELSTSRCSSWQYELQKLKFSNQRLSEEIAELEGNRGPSQKPAVPFMSSLPFNPRMPPPEPAQQQPEWPHQVHHSYGVSTTPLKRTWEEANG
jgi:PAS domain S-box-containing protein